MIVKLLKINYYIKEWFYRNFGFQQIEMQYIKCSKNASKLLLCINNATDIKHLDSLELAITNTIKIFPEEISNNWLLILGKNINDKRKYLECL